MLISKKFKCPKCGSIAYEYVGMEGGKYGSPADMKKALDCKHKWKLISTGNKL